MSYYVTLFLFCVACSAALTWIVLKLLPRLQMMDTPNARSNHQNPTPRGGGMAIMDTFFGAVIILALLSGELPTYWPILLGGFLLALVSLGDDMFSLPVWLRLLAQAIITVPSAWWILGDASILNGLLPKPLEIIFISLSWLWFINLYNFMDGIDGITGVETLVICTGVGIVVHLTQLPPEFLAVSVILAGATLGFLLWNWHPAHIFMGDVGSVPLGFFMGWLLLELAKFGYWQAALILPLYYLADSTITLIKRVVNREKIWEAHSKHYYQQAVRRGLSHSMVAATIGFFGTGLTGLAVMRIVMPDSGLIPLVASVCFTVLLLYGLQYKPHAHS